MAEIIMNRLLLSCLNVRLGILLNFLLNDNQNNKEFRAAVCKYQPKLSRSGTSPNFFLIDNPSMNNEKGYSFGSIWTTHIFPAPFFLIDLWKCKYLLGQKGIVKNGPYLKFLLCQIDKILQILTIRHNLEFRKLTFYGLIRYHSIRIWKQISGQMSLSGLQDLKFNPNLKRDFAV